MTSNSFLNNNLVRCGHKASHTHKQEYIGMWRTSVISKKKKKVISNGT